MQSAPPMQRKDTGEPESGKTYEIAGLVTALVIWLAHGLIYRWTRTRLSDEAVDAALTRLAHRLRQRPFGRKTDPAPSV